MPSIASKVREFAKSLGQNTTFTTLQLLSYGSRNAVDIELCRMVKNGTIKRLAAGVFMNLVAGIKFPGAVEIARIKAERFGKRILESTRSIYDNDSRVFRTDGCRSSFRTIHGRMHLKHLAPGKFKRQSKRSKLEDVDSILEDEKLELFDCAEPVLPNEKLDHVLYLACRLARLILRLLASRQYTGSQASCCQVYLS